MSFIAGEQAFPFVLATDYDRLYRRRALDQCEALYLSMNYEYLARRTDKPRAICVQPPCPRQAGGREVLGTCTSSVHAKTSAFYIDVELYSGEPFY